MGNRGVITTLDGWYNDGIGIYLHWNGGRDSVEAFLAYCKLKQFRYPDQDSYGWARLCQVIANFIDSGGLSVGIERISNLDCDNYDNGVYIIKGWEIVGREYKRSAFKQTSHPLRGMLKAINAAQPEDLRISEEEIDRYVDELEVEE